MLLAVVQLKAVVQQNRIELKWQNRNALKQKSGFCHFQKREISSDQDRQETSLLLLLLLLLLSSSSSSSLSAAAAAAAALQHMTIFTVVWRLYLLGVTSTYDVAGGMMMMVADKYRAFIVACLHGWLRAIIQLEQDVEVVPHTQMGRRHEACHHAARTEAE